MGIADKLNEARIVEHDCDSRSVWICRQDDIDRDAGDREYQLVPVATTGSTENEEYGIVDVRQEKNFGHWTTIIEGEDGTTAWWDEESGRWEAS